MPRRVRGRPGATEDGRSIGLVVRNQVVPQIAPIDVQRGDLALLEFDGDEQRPDCPYPGCWRAGPRRRGSPPRQGPGQCAVCSHQSGRRTTSAAPHLGIGHANLAVFGHSLVDPAPALDRVGFQVGARTTCKVCSAAANGGDWRSCGKCAPIQSCRASNSSHNRCRACCFWSASAQSISSAALRLGASNSDKPICSMTWATSCGQGRQTADDLVGRVAQQVQGVFHPPAPPQRAGVQRQPQGLGVKPPRLRASSTVRSNNRWSIPVLSYRIRKSNSAPWENAGSSAPKHPNTNCQRLESTVSSIAS